MFIEIRALELHPIHFEEEFGPGGIDLGDDIRQRGSLKANGRADLVEEHTASGEFFHQPGDGLCPLPRTGRP